MSQSVETTIFAVPVSLHTPDPSLSTPPGHIRFRSSVQALAVARRALPGGLVVGSLLYAHHSIPTHEKSNRPGVLQVAVDLPGHRPLEVEGLLIDRDGFTVAMLESVSVESDREDGPEQQKDLSTVLAKLEKAGWAIVRPPSPDWPWPFWLSSVSIGRAVTPAIPKPD